MTTDTASNVPPAVWKAALWISSRWSAKPWPPCATIPLGDGQYIEMPVCQMDVDELQAAFDHAAGQCGRHIDRYLTSLDDDDAWMAATWLWIAAVCRGAWLGHTGEADDGADDLLRRLDLNRLAPGVN